MKPFVPVSLICADTTAKAHLAARAIDRTLEQIQVEDFAFLTNQSMERCFNGTATVIPDIKGLEGYSNWCIKEMSEHVTSSHALVIQADGYVLNGNAWDDNFLSYDYIGAPFNPSGVVGNGGFSLRSKRLLDYMAKAGWDDCHPEDSAICVRHREELEKQGFKFAPLEVAERFAIEGRSWDREEWTGMPNLYANSFGFHSFLTRLPKSKKPCNIFHSSGDAGDVIYGLPAMKALGGGVLFLSADNRYPYPLNSRWARNGGKAEWVNNLAPLIEHQDYVWGCRYTHGTPFSTDYDLNKFRVPWKDMGPTSFDTILKLNMDAWDLPMPKTPWLTVKEPIVIPGKPFVVNRTQRYHNYEFPWDRFLDKYADQIAFVGSPEEYQLFKGLCLHKQIHYEPTTDALHLARVIAGCQRFIGNQSLALSIAHGLHKAVCVEEWPCNPNCRYVRPQALYFLPAKWLD